MILEGSTFAMIFCFSQVVGLNLRDFLASVDAEIENLASSTHKEVIIFYIPIKA